MYGKLENGNLIYAPKYFTDEHKKIINPSHDEYVKRGYYEIEHTTPEGAESGYVNIPYWEQEDDKIVQKWRKKKDNSPLSAEQVAEMFVKQNIQTLDVDDETALRMVSFYPEWSENSECVEGYIYQFNSNLYRCITAHTSQADWTPDVAVGLFVKVTDPSVEYPEWVAPTGAHDAYALGAKVFHNDKKWVSILDSNVYEPGIAGWEEVTNV